MAKLALSDVFADPMHIDPTAGWVRVPVAEIFATELLPIMDNHVGVQRAWEDAVSEWLAGNPWMKKRVGRWTYSSHKVSPFMMTTSDGAFTSVEANIEAYYEGGDPLARAYYSIMDLLTDEAELELPKSTITALEKKLNDIERSFEPKRDDARFWTPMHACHIFNALPAFALAHAWRPETDWRILAGSLHTTVVSAREKLAFDLVLADTADMDVVEFACRAAPEEKAA